LLDREQELFLVTRSRHGEYCDMIGKVNGGSVNPEWTPQPPRRYVEKLAKPWHEMEPAGDCLSHGIMRKAPSGSISLLPSSSANAPDVLWPDLVRPQHEPVLRG
jgi:hypothetical protein